MAMQVCDYIAIGRAHRGSPETTSTPFTTRFRPRPRITARDRQEASLKKHIQTVPFKPLALAAVATVAALGAVTARADNPALVSPPARWTK